MTKIAMWSGPRNISTTLMRAFGSRPDTFVSDEPFYAHYLDKTGKKHPLRENIIRNYEINWKVVVKNITGEIPNGKQVWYQIAPWKNGLAWNLYKELPNEYFKSFQTSCGTLKTLNTKTVSPIYEFANALYFFDKKFFFENGRYWDWKNVELFEINNKIELIDIDTEQDFIIAQSIWENRTFENPFL